MQCAADSRTDRGLSDRTAHSGNCIVQVVISFICLLHLNSAEIIAIVYGVGLLHSAVSHIVAAFRRTAIVYVQ